MYFLLRGLRHELEHEDDTSRGEFIDKVESYLDGHNYGHRVIDLGTLLKTYRAKPYLIALNLTDSPARVIKEPDVFASILEYLFNVGVDSVDNIEELTASQLIEPVLEDLSPDSSVVSEKDNDMDEPITSFVLDGSNIARHRHSSLDAYIQDVLLCKKRLIELGAHEDNIYIVFGSGIRHHLKDMDESGFQVLIGHDNIVQAPAGQDDDLFIIKFAKETNSYIITNDRYRDYRKKHPKLKRYIEIRLIKYTILKDIITFDEDIKNLIG